MQAESADHEEFDLQYFEQEIENVGELLSVSVL
jgi:hypothetical protein